MLTLTACEAILGCSGTIYSAQTRQPIRGAKVFLLMDKYPNSDSTTTDSAGHFDVGEFIGIVGNGPEPGLLIYHPGYQPLFLPDANRLNKGKKSFMVENLELYLKPYTKTDSI